MPNTAVTLSVGGDLAPLERQIANTVRQQRNLNIGGNANASLTGLSKSAKDFDSAMEQAQRRVLSFGTVAAALYGVKTAFEGIISTTVKVEQSIADINVILNASGESLNRFKSSLFNIGSETGNSFFSAAEAAKEFSRQGLGLEQTLGRTKDALILSRISGLEVKDSIEAITASVNSFQKAMLTSNIVVNKFAAVDANFAVSSADLAEAVKRSAAAADDAGVSFDDFLGLVTAVQQQTARGGAVIGNALKSIFTRIADTGSIEQLKEMGVNVDKSMTGLEKLKAIAEAVKLNPEFAAEIRKIPGGVFQINVLSAALRDLNSQNSVTAKASRDSANAFDEANTRSRALNETLKSELTKTLNGLIQASAKVGDIAFKPTITKILGQTNSVLELFNKDKAERDGYAVGDFFASGFEKALKGIGNYLSGPGLVTFLVIAAKILGGFVIYTERSLFSLLSINKGLAGQEKAQGQIDFLLRSQGKNYTNNNSLAERALLTEKERLRVLQLQTATLTKNQGLFSIATTQVGSNIAGNTIGGIGGLGLKTGIFGANSYSQEGAPGYASNLAFKSQASLINKSQLELQNPFRLTSQTKGSLKIFQDDVNHYLDKIVGASATGASSQVAFYSQTISDQAAKASAGPRTIALVNKAIRSAISQGESIRQMVGVSAISSLNAGVANLSSVPTGFSANGSNFATPSLVNFGTGFGSQASSIQQANRGIVLAGGQTSFASQPARRDEFGRFIRPQTPIISGGGSSFGQVSGSYQPTWSGVQQTLRTYPTGGMGPSFYEANNGQLVSGTQGSSYGAMGGYYPPGFGASNARQPRNFGRYALASSFLAPVVGGAVQDMIGYSTPFQRGMGAISAGLGRSAGYAGLGFAMTGTPQGAGLGAVAGVISNIGPIAKAFTDIAPDLKRKLEESTSVAARFKDSVDQYLKLSNDLAELYANNLTPPLETVVRLERERALLLAGSLTDEQRNKLKAATSDKDREKVLTDAYNLKAKEKQIDTLNQSINEISPKGITDRIPGLNSLIKANPFSLISDVFFAENPEKRKKSFVDRASPTVDSILRDTNDKNQEFSSLFSDKEAFNFLQSEKDSAKYLSLLRVLAEKGGFDVANSGLANIAGSKDAKGFSDLFRKFIENTNVLMEGGASGVKIKKEPFVNDLEKGIPEMQLNQLMMKADRAFQLQGFSLRNQSRQEIAEDALTEDSAFFTEFQIAQGKFDISVNKFADSIKEAKMAAGTAFFDSIGGLNDNIKDFRQKISKQLDESDKSKIGVEGLNKIKNAAETVATRALSDINDITTPKEARALVESLEAEKARNESRISKLSGEERDSAITTDDLYATLIKGINESIINRASTIMLENQKGDVGMSAMTATFEAMKKNSENELNIRQLGRSNEIGSQIYQARSDIKAGRPEGVAALSQIYRDNGIDISKEERALIDKKIEENKQKLLDISDEGISTILPDISRQLENEFNLFNSLAEKQNFINDLKIKQKEIQDKINENLGDAVELEKEFALVAEERIMAQNKTAFDQGRITGDQYRQQGFLTREKEQDINGGRLSNKSLGDTFTQGFSYNTRDFYDEMERNAAGAAAGIKSSFKDAFQSFADGTLSAGNAFNAFLSSIANKLTMTALDQGLNSILGLVGSGAQNLTSGWFSGRSGGGRVGYSTGGVVQGGSGVRDDVPAMLTNGEFVIKKNAAVKYGPSVLKSINDGTAFFDGHNSIIKSSGNSAIDATFANTYLMDDLKQPKEGAFLLDPRLSSFALDDPNNPQNANRANREQALGSRLRAIAEAQKAFDKQQRQRQQAALIAAGIGLLGVGIQGAGQSGLFSSAPASGGGVQPGWGSPTGGNYFGSSGSGGYNAALYVPHAQGGPIFGGTSPTDNVPAMLTGGEFVLTRKAVDKYGTDFANKLNRGEIKAFADGGIVGPDSSGQTLAGNSINFDRVLSKFSESVDSLRKSVETSSGRSSVSSGIVVNNSTIINIDKAGNVTSSQSSNTNGSRNGNSQDDNNQDMMKSRKFADSLQAAVYKIIVEEKRPQGLLDFRR